MRLTTQLITTTIAFGGLPLAFVTAVALVVAASYATGAPQASSVSTAESASEGTVVTAGVTRRDLVDTVTIEGIVRIGAGVTVRRGYTTTVDSSVGDVAAGPSALVDGALAATDATGGTIEQDEPSATVEPSAPAESTAHPTPSSTASTRPSSTASSAPSGIPPTSTSSAPSPSTGAGPGGSTPTPTATGGPTAPPVSVNPTAGSPGGSPTGAPLSPPSVAPGGGRQPGGQSVASPPVGGQQPAVGANGANGESGGAGPGITPTETVTSVAAVGTPVGTGVVLYSADGQPVVAVVSDYVFWRDLDTDSEAGPDIAVVEQALVDLGYGDDITVDQTFDSATAEAIESWESDLGRSDPDATVSIGDLVTVPAGATVTRVDVAPGDRVGPGSAVLDLGSGQREIVLDVAADQTAPWTQGAAVTIQWPDGTPRSGSVTSVGTDVAVAGEGVAGGTVEVVVEAPGGSDGLVTGSAVEVTAVVEIATQVLTIPISAIVEDAGEPAVRVVGRGTVPVTYGLIVGGLVEVLDGVVEGDVIRVPGTR